MNCRCCLEFADQFANSVILNKYDALYLRCRGCGAVFVDDLEWADVAYANPIADADIGLPSRAIRNSETVSLILKFLYPKTTTFLDYGSGDGLFVRIMRDRGFDFRAFDKYTTNRFAVGHDWDGYQKVDLVTAFELFEHVSNPRELLKSLLEMAPLVLISTELLPSPPPLPDEWWYYALDTGQHITFYTPKSLLALAKASDASVYSVGSLHFFSRTPINVRKLRIILNPKLGIILKDYAVRESLLSIDAETFNKGNAASS
jgi:hypothetical protein